MRHQLSGTHITRLISIALLGVSTVALTEPPEVRVTEGRTRKANDKLTGTLMVKTDEDTTRVAKEITWGLDVTEMNPQGKETRSFRVHVKKGEFTHRHFLSGMKYHIKLRKFPINASAPQYKGEWNFTYPRKAEEHNVKFNLSKIPHTEKTVRVKVQYKRNQQPIAGARLTLWQIVNNNKTPISTKTNGKGKASFTIAHRAGSSYKLEFRNEHSSIEELPDPPARYDKWEYPRLKSYESDRFTLQEDEETTFVWEVEKKEKTVVLDVKGKLKFEREFARDVASVGLVKPAYPEGYFNGVRVNKKKDGSVVKRFWGHGPNGRNHPYDHVAPINVRFNKEGAVGDFEYTDKFTDARYIHGGSLVRTGEDTWTGFFFDVPNGTYSLRVNGPTIDTEDKVLKTEEPISITPDTERPLELNARIQKRETPKYAKLTGKVTDKQGNPMQNARVILNGGVTAGTRVRADGTYTIDSRVPAGHYLVRIYNYDSGRYQLPMIRELQRGTNRMNISLKRSPSFEGQISTSEGKPASTAVVSAVLLNETGNPELHETGVDEEGYFKLAVPEDNATYAIKASRPAAETFAYKEANVQGPNTRLNMNFKEAVTVKGNLSIPEKFRNKYDSAGVSAFKGLHHFPISLGNAKLKNDSHFKLLLPPDTYELYCAFIQKKKQPHIIPIGTLTVPGDQDQVTYEKQITPKMVKGALSMKQFKQRARKAKADYSKE